MCKMFMAAGRFKELSHPDRESLFHFMTDLFHATKHDNTDQDASGFYAWSGDRRVYAREGIDPITFTNNHIAWRQLVQNPAKLYMCHARGAMSDASDSRNNHPFVGKHVALMHEGWIDDHLRLADLRGLTLTSQTDSELYMRIADERRRATGDRKEWNPISCMRAMLQMTTAPTALALLNHSDRHPCLYFAKNDAIGNHTFGIYRVPKFNAVFLVSTPEMWKIATEKNNLHAWHLAHAPKPYDICRIQWDTDSVAILK